MMKKRGRQGDKEKGRSGDKEIKSPCLLVPLSPPLLIG